MIFRDPWGMTSIVVYTQNNTNWTITTLRTLIVSEPHRFVVTALRDETVDVLTISDHLYSNINDTPWRKNLHNWLQQRVQKTLNWHWIIWIKAINLIKGLQSMDIVGRGIGEPDGCAMGETGI